MQTYIISQLNDPDFSSSNLQIDGNNIVWEGRDISSENGNPFFPTSGIDSEIFFFDGNDTIRLTDNSTNDLQPRLDGNNIVWEGNTSPLVVGASTIFNPDPAEIILYDGESFSNITTNQVADNNPQISGENIVWSRSTLFNEEELEALGGEGLFLFNGVETIKISDTSSPESPIHISGDNIVWLDFDGNDTEIFLYDGTETIQLTDNNERDNEVQISGDNVVWTSGDGNDREIFLYDGTETIQLTNNNLADSVPQVSNENVVWSGSDENDREIFLYDGTETVQLTDNEQDDSVPQISGDNVVWSGFDGNDTEIFLYDGNETVQLTDNEQNDNFPLISENNIVWENRSNTDNASTNVLLAQAANLDSLTGPTVYRFFNKEKGVHFYTNSEAERDNVLNNIPTLTFEGESYQSVNPQVIDTEVQPVYRFFNNDTEVHLYTISEAERDFIRDNLNNYTFEGEAFDAYISEQESTIPIYRFYNPELNTHFYTPSSAERDFVASELDNYVAEGVAYYGFPIENSAF